MAGASSNGLSVSNWRGVLRHLSLRSARGRVRDGGGGRTGEASVRSRAGVERLEDRRLLSVSLVSANPAGQAGLTGVVSNDAEISDDGRFVVFTSLAGDLASGATDTDPDADVYLRDTQTNTTTLVSGNNNTAFSGRQPSIDATGRFIAFVTDTKLSNSDTNGGDDIYVWDAQTPSAFTLVSVGAGGSAVGGLQPSISDNGRVVAFVSSATADQLVAGATDTNAGLDVFVRNLDAGTTALVSSTPGTSTTGEARADQPAISGDGNFVAFRSQAGNLIAAAEPAGEGDEDVFRRGVAPGAATELVSVAAGGGAGTGTSPSINDNGNLVAFSSDNANIVAGDVGSSFDVFVRDMTGGATEVVSVTAAGVYGNANSTSPSISGDGNFVAFLSAASNFFTNNATGSDVVVKNRTDESLLRASETDAGEPASAGGTGQSSTGPVINQNGTAVAFASGATNLVPNTEPAAETDEDVFVWKAAGVTPGDTTAPTASITAPNVAAAGATQYQVTVIYADSTAVDVTTVGQDDITVTGPGAATTPLTVTGAVATPSTNAASVTVVYTVTPPGGTWDAADNGTYTVTLPANAVRDTSGNGVAAGGGTFSVNAVPGGGTTGGPDLLVAIAPKPLLPTAIVGSNKGKVRLTITNQGDTPVATPVAIQLRAVPTGTTTGAPADITTITRPLRLKAGRSRGLAIPFVYPSVADGTYNITATIDSTNVVAETDESNNTATSTAPVAIALPVVDLVPTVGSPARGSFTIGRRTSVPITIVNNGNVPASGIITIDLFASGDNLIDAGDLPLASVTKKIRLRNGQSRPIRVSFVVPANLTAGEYFVTTNVDSAGVIQESDETNNTAVSSTPFQAT